MGGMIIVEHHDHNENQPENTAEKSQDSSAQDDGFGLQRRFSSLTSGIASIFAATKGAPAAQQEDSQSNATSNTVTQLTAS